MTHKPTPINIRQRPENSAKHFARAVFLHAQGHVIGRHEKNHLIKPDDIITPLIITRAAVTPGSTTTPGWALELVRDAFLNFLLDLAPYGGGPRLIAQAIKVNAHSVNVSHFPVRAGGPAVPAWVAENGAIPVRSADFDDTEVGPLKKMAHILPYTREASKQSNADTIMETMLREDVVAGIDGAFFSTSAGSAAAHAGLLYGVTPLAGYAGGDQVAMKQDLTALSVDAATGGSGAVTFIMNPTRIVRLRILDPVLFASLDIAPSAAVPDDRIIAADGAALIVSVDPAPEIMVATQAAIHMNNVPLELVSSTGPTVASPIRSLWQTASIAVRVIHDLAFAKRRSTAVSYLDGATW